MSEPVTPETLVTHTDENGRTLSGMGADVEQLAETMERHAPPEKKEPEAITPPAARSFAFTQALASLGNRRDPRFYINGPQAAKEGP